MEVMEIDQQPAQQARNDLSEPIRNLEEERRKLNDDRRLLNEERRAFDLEKQALEKEQHKLQKLINFKKRVQEELEVFWKEKQSEGEQVEDDATTSTTKQPEKAREEEPEDEDMTVNIKSLLHRLLKREQEISEQNISMSLSSRTGSRRKGGEEGVDDITNPLATDDADFVLEEEYDSDMDEHDLVLDESFSSSESDADKKDKKKKKKNKKKLKKQEKKRRKEKKHKKGGRAKEKDLGDVFAESKEAVGSLLDAASHQEKMEQLKAFRDKFGHCKVPWAWKDNPQLGRWVGRMRSMKRNGKLDEAVQKELESMDFVWNPITENSTQWDEKLGQLKQFRAQNGHLKVPWGWKDNPALGRWVGRIRQQRRDGRLQPERIKELTEMGFVWEFANAPNKNKKNKRKRKESKQEKKEKKKDKKGKEKKKDKKHKKQKLSDHQDDSIPAAGEKKETNGEPNGQSKKTEITIEDEEESGFAELAFASEEAAKIRSRLKEDEEDSSNV